jgi:CDP-glucose 4,6-dehydratase
MTSETFGDVRDIHKLKTAVTQSNSQFVIHLAAQAIVLKGYTHARETFDVNINGTLNILEASLDAGCERILVVTTDKVYKDAGKSEGYEESDALQGWDPYAASKAAADILAQSWLELYRDKIRVDIARGGNVIGGGDDSEFRLVPDIEKAVTLGLPVTLRNSAQVRPWQHALDCLDGYLAIANGVSGDVNTWNVGPSNDDSQLSVEEFSKLYLDRRGSNTSILTTEQQSKETEFLRLDSSRILRELAWQPRWNSQRAISMTAKWHKRVADGESTRDVTFSQVDDYLERNVL